MTHNKKRKSIISMLLQASFTVCFFFIRLVYESIRDYKPMNSKGRKISNANKRRHKKLY